MRGGVGVNRRGAVSGCCRTSGVAMRSTGGELAVFSCRLIFLWFGAGELALTLFDLGNPVGFTAACIMFASRRVDDGGGRSFVLLFDFGARDR